MAQCFEPYCSVDPASGALSITTKGGTCTVVPGDQVSVTENPQGWIITVNGAPTLIPRIDPGDDVSFVETPDNYVITINGAPHLIPKCRYYRDCDGNVLDSCERIVTCDDLVERGFISCVDADDFNMVPRNVDGVATMCLEIAWDRVCAEAELVTDPAGHTVLLCGPNGVKKIDPDSLLADLCYNDVPDLGLTCGNTSRLILVTDADGCDRLARIDSVGVTLASGRYWNVRGAKPENTSGYVLPDDFPTPNLYYSVADYLADGGTDPNDRSGINDAIITNSRVAAASFVVPCTKLYNFLVSALFVREATAEEAYSRYATLSFRWRVDGGQWFYATTPGTGQVTQFAARFAIEGRIDVDTTITLPEGNVDMELFYLSSDYNAGDPGNARLQANTNAPSFGSGSPSFRLQQIV